MYTETELLDKKPRELLQIVLDLQRQLAQTKNLLASFSANQVSEEQVLEMIRICADSKLSQLQQIELLIGLWK